MYAPVVISVNPCPTVKVLVPCASNTPMIKSLAWDVVIEALAVPLSPLLVLAVPSNGEAIFSPDTANAVAAQWLAPLFRGMLIVTCSAEGIMAYHVPRRSPLVMLALLVQVTLGVDEGVPNVWDVPISAET